MREKYFLSLGIICAVITQGLMVISDHNINKSSISHIRQKRLIDRTYAGGRPIHLIMAPYIVNILKDGISFCAGSILDPDVIISTTSCLWVTSYSRFSVLSGSDSRNNGTHHIITERMFVSVSGLVIFKIVPPINLQQGLNSKIVLFHGDVPQNTYGIFSGWGSTGLDRRNEWIFPEQLMQTRLPIISHQECIQEGNSPIPLTIRHLCTLDRTKRRATSLGDQGGPLVYNRRLLGVLLHRSMEIGVQPDVFINLNLENHQQWVTERLNHLRN